MTFMFNSCRIDCLCVWFVCIICKQYVHTYLPTYLTTYLPTYIRTYIHTYTHTYMHAYMHACMHPYIHTSIHPYIHTSIHPYIHTYTVNGSNSSLTRMMATSILIQCKPMINQMFQKTKLCCPTTFCAAVVFQCLLKVLKSRTENTKAGRFRFQAFQQGSEGTLAYMSGPCHTCPMAART